MSDIFLDDLASNAPKELLVKLGNALIMVDGELGARPTSDREIIDRALTWLGENRQKIADLIHNNPKLRSLAYEQRDKQILISTLADALTSSFTGVPVMVIATLVVQYALDHFLKRNGNSKE